MKRLAIALTILAAAPLAASADVSKEDIKKLIGAGVGEEVILSFIRSHGPAAKMSADDLVELKQAGATEKVLATMAGGSNATPAAPAAPARTYTYAPSTTYVADTPVYSSDYYYPYYSYPYFSYWPSYYYWGCYPRYSYSYSSCYPRYGYSYGYPRYSYGYSGYRYAKPYHTGVRY